jgi:hypothetical protein
MSTVIDKVDTLEKESEMDEETKPNYQNLALGELYGIQSLLKVIMKAMTAHNNWNDDRFILDNEYDFIPVIEALYEKAVKATKYIDRPLDQLK